MWCIHIVVLTQLSKETIAVIMMLYKNTKVKVHSPDGDRLLQRYSRCTTRRYIALYLFICLDYVLRTSIDLMKENCFKVAKERSRRYPEQTITDANYINDITLLAKSPTQAKPLLHSLEWATGDIGLHINADKTEYMCFNKKRRHLYAIGWSSETSGQVHLPQK